MSRKMLIVEDDENISELLVCIWSVRVSRPQRRATAKRRSLFKEFSPDIILLDVMLPRLDGWVCSARSELSQMSLLL